MQVSGNQEGEVYTPRNHHQNKEKARGSGSAPSLLGAGSREHTDSELLQLAPESPSCRGPPE